MMIGTIDCCHRTRQQKLDFEDIIADFALAKLEKFNFEAAIDLFLLNTFVHHFVL